MREEDPCQAVFTIQEKKEGWYVAWPDQTRIGPYLKNIALQVAVTEVLLARRRGLNARLEVRDEFGGTHSCMMVDEANNSERCERCEASRPSAILSVKCPLFAAIRGR